MTNVTPQTKILYFGTIIASGISRDVKYLASDGFHLKDNNRFMKNTCKTSKVLSLMHLICQDGQNKGVDKCQHKYIAHILRNKSQFPKYYLLYAFLCFWWICWLVLILLSAWYYLWLYLMCTIDYILIIYFLAVHIVICKTSVSIVSLFESMMIS